MDFHWDLKDVFEFDQMWHDGVDVEEIALYFDRDVDEVALLIIDRARRGRIERRAGGICGRGIHERNAIGDGTGSSEQAGGSRS